MGIYILLLVFLGMSAIFSGMEIAYISSNKLRIELNREKGTLSQRIIAEFNEDASHFITALLIGNNVALVGFSGYMSILLSQHFGISEDGGWYMLLLQTIITTVIVLIFGEFFPKVLFRISPYNVLLALAIPIKYLVYKPLKPITYLFSILSRWMIKKLMPEKYDESKDEFTVVDLEHYIKDIAAGQVQNNEEDDLNSEIFEKALYLKEVKVRECMIPRTEIQAIDINASIAELKEKFIDTKLSRLLVYENSIDNIKGYVHHIDLIISEGSIQNLLYPMPVVPGTMSARDLLTLFTKQNKNIAFVVDEFGGTAGIVTMEDLMEEIFGEIQDEHDDDEYIEKQVGPHEFIFSGRLEIDYINEKYKLNIPIGEYETLSGYVVVNHENIPEENETIEIGEYEFVIVSAEDNRIETIRLKKLPRDE